MQFKSPLIQSNLVNPAPTGPHLALLTKPDEAIAIPVGAQLFIISDPDRADRIVPVVLAQVNNKSLVFRCNCKRPGCTRVLRFPMKVEGHHPER